MSRSSFYVHTDQYDHYGQPHDIQHITAGVAGLKVDVGAAAAPVPAAPSKTPIPAAQTSGSNVSGVSTCCAELKAAEPNLWRQGGAQPQSYASFLRTI